MATGREYDEAGEVAADEVLVEITEDADGDLVATVAWGEWVSDGVTRHGDLVGPMTVGEALFKADEVAELYGFGRVVVSLPGDDVWNPNWGTLRRRPLDFDAVGDDGLREADDGDEGRAPFIDLADDDDAPPLNR